MPPLWVQRLEAWGNRQPQLTARRLLWLLTGLPLAALYLSAALGLALTLVFIPFVPSALRLALFALDGGITREPRPAEAGAPGARPWDDPLSALTIFANCVWLVFFGWAFALMHLSAALLQAATVVGFGTALTQLKLLGFVAWPFGRQIYPRALPTRVAPDESARLDAEGVEVRTPAGRVWQTISRRQSGGGEGRYVFADEP
jgi:uncharacterized membrane protein YccF (DUF307 family)